MKKALVFIALLAMLFPVGSGASQAMNTQMGGDASILGETGSGMPPRPIPDNPIPHHDVGHPSKAGQFSTQVSGVDEQGVKQTYTLTGLDALLADGIFSDPFAGNYRLVELDKIMYSAFFPSNFAAQTFDITPTLEVISGSQYTLGNYWANDIASGDLNGDDQMEQLAAWLDSTGRIYMSISEIPSQPARAGSAPVALGYSDNTGDLLVRGYDDAMWHSHYDGSTWGTWVNAGGTLLSAPAIVSRGSGQFDAFAIGTDNLTYWQHWEGGVFSGTWELVDVQGYWPEVEWIPPIPEVDGPSVVAHEGGEMDLFRRGPDNTLRWRHFNGSTWGDWVSKGGFLSSAPSAVAIEGGGVQVFGRGLDGNVWYRIYSGGSWEKWQRVELPEGLRAASAPTAASPQAGKINVYLRGSDDALWQIEYSGGSWGEWTAGGGELGSCVAAAAWPAKTELFAQRVNHRLQHSYDGITWGDFQSLPEQGVYDTGAQAVPPGNPIPHDNYLIDIGTGYFTGERSEQVAMVYATAAGEYRLAVWDMQDGFTPYLLAEVDTPVSSYGSVLAAADVNSDGVDDIAIVNLTDSYHYQVSIYHTQVDDSGTWSLIPGVSGPVIYAGNRPFGGTLRIAAGELNGDLDDEIVVLSDWGNGVGGMIYFLTVQLYLFDDEDPASTVAAQYTGNTFGDVFIDHPWATGLGLAVGDMNGDTVDEFVLTWPTGFDEDDWPDLYREMRLLGARNYDPDDPSTLDLLATYSIPGYQRHSYLDTLAVGDLDRDFDDEIVFYQNEQLSIYEFEYEEVPAKITPIAYKSFSEQNELYVKLVSGDYTGESLRVGSPTFRSQDNTGGLIALINEPPKHIDTLDGETIDINSQDEDTYSAYENESYQGTNMSIQVHRGWGFASGTAWGVGDPEGTHVADSITSSYGEDFTRTNNAFSQITFGENLQASSDDIVIYTGQSLNVWEYPTYDDDSGVPGALIMVVFPDAGLNNYGAQNHIETGNSSCDFWYAPEHQINNVWSYPASIDQLKDFNGEILNSGETVTVGPGDIELWTKWEELSEDQKAHSCSLGVDSMHEWQIGGDTIRAQYAPLGVGVSYDIHLPYVKETTNKSYSKDTLSTREVFGGEETTVSVYFNAVDPSGKYNYEVTPYLYWAKDGYLVLDYLTNPKNTSFWQKYTLADPAFILPWASGQCPGKELFSKDIQINPPFAYYGETVAITATVHNFSNIPMSDVRLRFYLGEPEEGRQIGSDQSIFLPARGMVDVPVTWEATGAVQQRIYVVIDPDQQKAEMHDETSNPEKDNNVGFGVVALGNSGYLDPGGKVYFDYQYLTYTDTQNLPTSVYIPTAAMTKTLHVEMAPLTTGSYVRHGFNLSAYMGGSDRGIPWDLTFQPMPAAVWIYYSETDIAGLDENNLVLYWYNDDEKVWEDAACGEYQRYPGGNYMIVPVCKVGMFAILSPYAPVFLPMVTK